MADLTFGGKAVGIKFNPSGNTEVDFIKNAAANFIDSFHPEQFPEGTDGEVIAMKKLALRKAQEAQMWAVKAATWGTN
jgi:hypothetical protein